MKKTPVLLANSLRHNIAKLVGPVNMGSGMQHSIRVIELVPYEISGVDATCEPEKLDRKLVRY
jgi:hypothetical protein